MFYSAFIFVWLAFFGSGDGTQHSVSATCDGKATILHHQTKRKETYVLSYKESIKIDVGGRAICHAGPVKGYKSGKSYFSGANLLCKYYGSNNYFGTNIVLSLKEKISSRVINIYDLNGKNSHNIGITIDCK